MHTRCMKQAIFLLLTLLFILSWLIISPANASRNCYISTQKELDASAFQVQANPNAREFQCISTFQTITALGACLDAANNRIPSMIKPQFAPVVSQLVGWIRYQMKDVSQLRQEHDADCSAYIDTMFVLPDLTQ